MLGLTDASEIFSRDKHLLLKWPPLELMLRHVAASLYDRRAFRQLRRAGRTYAYVHPGAALAFTPPPKQPRRM